jgi:hypothetical protein
MDATNKQSLRYENILNSIRYLYFNFRLEQSLFYLLKLLRWKSYNISI